MGDVSADRAEESLDALAEDLQRLRLSVGLSYRVIAQRIAQQREADGMPPAAAQIAHTTVSDVFRTGRTRINAALVAEIVRVLGGDPEEWRRRCVQAMARARRAAAPEIEAIPVPSPAPTSAPEVPASAGETRAPADEALVPSTAWRPTRGLIALIVIGGVLLNSTGKFINPLFGDVFFFDMIGTAAAAILLGPWWAALTGVLFCVVEILKMQWGAVIFGTTMIPAGIVWGIGVRRFGMARSLPRFLVLSAVVACVVTALAAPIIIFFYDGFAGRGADGYIAWAAESLGLWGAVFTANITVSMIDKVLSGAAAYLLARVVVRARVQNDGLGGGAPLN